MDTLCFTLYLVNIFFEYLLQKCAPIADQDPRYSEPRKNILSQKVSKIICCKSVKIDKDVVVIVPVFDQERLHTPLVVPYQRNTNRSLEKKIEPMVIHVSTPFSFNSTKAVAWNYDPAVYVGDKPMHDLEGA